MIDLSNKNILFIAPKFYTYHQDIINYMESNGASVTFFAEDIYTPLYRFSNKIFPKIATKIEDKYRDTILNSVKQNSFDIVFVIRGGILSPLMMNKIKDILLHTKYIMYQWDSNNQSNYKNIIKYFDVVKTFDKKDAHAFNIEYLPLFYSKEYEKIKSLKSEKRYDIVFYGAYHSDRLEIVKFVEKYCLDNNLTFKYHLYITKMGLFRLILKGVIKLKDLKYLKTFTVDTKEILDVYHYSFSVLDIELNIQNGLTMRTFETLGSGLKLITTNKNIASEEIYNEKNIMILNRENLDFDLGFFKNPFDSDKSLQKYRFENWFNNLFKEGTI